MGAPDRTVRHLRLRARDEAGVKRSARQLEDALRCASLPDDGGRLLLVRRLDLGRFNGELSAQSLSLLIERRVAALGYVWVHGDTPQATHADAVWFEDRSEALLVLATRIATGTQSAAWFWPQVLPALRRERDAAVLMRCLIETLLAEAPALHDLPRLLGRLIERGHAERLPMLLDTQARALLARAAAHLALAHRIDVPPSSSGAPSRAWRAADGAIQHLPQSLIAAVPSLPVFLVAARWSAIAPTAVPATMPPAAARATTSGISTQRESLPGDAAMHPEAIRHDATHVADPVQREAPPVARDNAVLPATPEQAGTAPQNDDEPSAIIRDEAPRFDEMLITQAGGLLFLLPVLARLGFAAWSDNVPAPIAQHVAARVLQMALVRLRIDEADAAHVVPASLRMRSAPAIGFEPPAIWRDSRIAMADCAGRLDADIVAELWLRAARRYLRRVARIGLASLVLRPAGMRATPTHLDVFFDLRDTDVRVRRNALDVDPGWLPWLGRVVGFHYRQGLSS